MSDIRFNRWLHQSGTGGIHQDSSGNIGIGTSVPTAKVDVQGGDLKVGDQIFSSSGVSTFSSGLNVTSGSVGIGTDNPSSKLHLYSAGPQAQWTDSDNDSDSRIRYNGSLFIFEADSSNEIADSAFSFRVDGTNIANEKLRIDSSGNIGIGTTNPQRLLHLYSDSNNPLLIESPDQFADIVQADTGGSTRLRSDQGGFRFYTGGDASSVQALNATERLGITSTGDINVAAGSSVFVANGNLVFSTSGTGIDFSAASGSAAGSSSAVLDDYEEGTFTPIDSSGAGLTLTEARGHYVKVGNVVHCQVRIVWPSQSNANNARIGGFPFNANNPTDVSNGAVPSGFGYISSGSVIPQIHKSGGDDTTNFYNFSAAMTNANFSGIQVRFGVTYRTS